MTELFPSGVAYGEAFYDRQAERKQLNLHIKHSRHTVLIAPRRFGKTSLMRQVIEEHAYPHIWIDFMTLTSKEEAQQKLLQHVAELIVALGKTEEKVKALAKKYLAVFRPEISVDIFSVMKIKLNPNFSECDDLIEGLKAVDQVAQATKQRAVIICDEFQEIVHLDKDSTLQASIRHAAERAQNITYLFSGSKHRALRRLFNGKKNPLYELCDPMTLELIPEAYYREYLQATAEKKWGYPLSEEILKRLFQYTAYYPKYINALCARLWMHELAPTAELVDKLWEDYIFARKGGIREELGGLKLNERKLFRYLCFNPTNAPFSQAFLSGVGLSQAGVQRALESLQENDLVIYNGEIYRVIDPTYKRYFELF